MTTPTITVLPDGTVIEEWPGHHESQDLPFTFTNIDVSLVDPFAKHADHDQSSHGNWATYFHGTTHDAVDKILTEGLKPGMGLWGNGFEDGKAVLFLSTTEGGAASVIGSGGRPIAVIRTERETYRHDDRDLSDTVRYDDTIPPEEILGIRWYERNKDTGNVVRVVARPGQPYERTEFGQGYGAVEDPVGYYEPEKLFEFRKHADHDQSSHGNRNGGGKQEWPERHKAIEQMAQERIAKVFPRARVVFAPDVLSREALMGITEGFEQMAAEFPAVASDVVLVAADHNLTRGMAEAVVTATNNPETGKTEEGIGFLIDGVTFGLTNHGWHLEQRPSADGWAAQDRSDPQKWASSVVVHEFGHAVHISAIRNELGLPWANEYGDGKNDDLWDEVAGMNDGRDPVIFPSLFPDSKVASWTQGLDLRSRQVRTEMASLTKYAGRGRGELFAESFAVRRGLGDTTLPTGWDPLFEEMEASAKRG